MITKLSLATILLILFPSLAHSEIRAKIGYSHILCDYIQGGIDVAISVEKKVGRVAGELEVGFENHKINQIGYLNSFKIFVIGKVYFMPTVWFGLGGGLMNNFIYQTNEYYKDTWENAYVNNEWVGIITVGKDFPNWFIELQNRWGDLDINSNLPYMADMENHSRLDSIGLRVGYKW